MAPEVHHSHDEESDPTTADVTAISEALQRPVTRRTDVHFGSGHGFALGDEGHTSLELYPTTVRVSMGDRQLVLPRLPAQIGNDGVVFVDARGVLSVGPTGSVLFEYAPPAPTEAETLLPLATSTTTVPQETASSGERPPAPEPSQWPVSGDSARSTSPSDEPAASSTNRTERDKTKRILKGRLIAPPTFHPNPKSGALIGEFRVAVGSKDDPETTEFVKVSCFDNPGKDSFHASKLQELVDAGAIATGTQVTVVGWEHPLVRQGKRVGTQLYATVVKPVPQEKPAR